MSANFLFLDIFFSESDFYTITPHFILMKSFCSISLQLTMPKRKQFFTALGPKTGE